MRMRSKRLLIVEWVFPFDWVLFNYSDSTLFGHDDDDDEDSGQFEVLREHGKTFDLRFSRI